MHCVKSNDKIMIINNMINQMKAAKTACLLLDSGSQFSWCARLYYLINFKTNSKRKTISLLAWFDKSDRKNISYKIKK